MAPTIGSPALLLQMTTNLVHNAIVHNLPEDGTVLGHDQRRSPRAWCSRSRTPASSSRPQLVATLAEPFQRGTERIRTDHAGVGLGLAIVKSIAQAHDGHPHPGARLEVERRGGASCSSSFVSSSALVTGSRQVKLRHTYAAGLPVDRNPGPRTAGRGPTPPASTV